MENLKLTNTEELERLLVETETSVGEIRRELERRRALALECELSHLDEHLQRANGSWGDLKRFFQLVLDELRR